MASLVVVMVLFFIVSLVAAYTSRNLIFEQRTSGNQYRSTQALEAAEAGIEWALAMLNHGRITAACATSGDDTDSSFRERYLIIDTADPASASFGRVTRRPTSTGGFLLPSCVFDGTDWTCSCPTDGAPSLTPPSATGTLPAFRLFFRPSTNANVPPGTVVLEVNGCTRLDDLCLNPAGQGAAQGIGNEGTAYAAVFATLTGGPVAPPGAALTALGQVNAGGGGSFTARNADAASNGITVQAGGSVDSTGLTLISLPGVPPSASLAADDTALASLGADRLFSAIFNIWPATYQTQPGVLNLECSGSPCSASTVRSAIALNPGRPLWLPNGLSIDSSGDIGSATAPVSLVVGQTLDATVSGVTIHGFVYIDASTWTTSVPLQISGATVVAGSVGDVGASSFVYDANKLALLRVTTGSFVRLPGSWRDYTLNPLP